MCELHQEGHVGAVSNNLVDVFTTLTGLSGRADKHLSILNIKKRRPDIDAKDDFGDICLLFVLFLTIIFVLRDECWVNANILVASI